MPEIYDKKTYGSIEKYLLFCQEEEITIGCFNKYEHYLELWNKKLIYKGNPIRICDIKIGGIIESYTVIDANSILGIEEIPVYSGKKGFHHPKNILNNYEKNWWEICKYDWINESIEKIRKNKHISSFNA